MHYPDTKDELLAVLRQKSDVDPIKKAAILMGQITPRYFKMKSSRNDAMKALEEHVAALGAE